jgi:outer membrane protein assembly factor BamB
VIVGDSLYVGGYFGMVYRLNKRNGSVLWMAEVATGTPVAVTNDVAVVADTQGNLIGLDVGDGARLWVTEVNDGALSEPAVYGDMVFVSSFDENAYLVALENGAKIQKVRVGDGALTTPLVDNERVYLLTNSAKLMALKKK